MTACKLSIISVEDIIYGMGADMKKQSITKGFVNNKNKLIKVKSAKKN